MACNEGSYVLLIFFRIIIGVRKRLLLNPAMTLGVSRQKSDPMLYVLARTTFIPIVFITWVLYQVFVKKKRWNDVKGDVFVMSCFLVGWWGFFYWVFRG